MKFISGLILSITFGLYVMGYVDDRTRQNRAPTAIYQLPQ